MEGSGFRLLIVVPPPNKNLSLRSENNGGSANSVKPETLEATFDNITKTYGSFDTYLREGLKISESELAALRQHLLEP